jgi:predicted RNA-binding protein with RPS1 domain
LVHISEIDDHFVHNVADYVAPNARVVVKVLACKEGGKYEFSIKRAKGEVVPDSQPLEIEAPPEMTTAGATNAKTAPPSMKNCAIFCAIPVSDSPI